MRAEGWLIRTQSVSSRLSQRNSPPNFHTSSFNRDKDTKNMFQLKENHKMFLTHLLSVSEEVNAPLHTWTPIRALCVCVCVCVWLWSSISEKVRCSHRLPQVWWVLTLFMLVQKHSSDCCRQQNSTEPQNQRTASVLQSSSELLDRVTQDLSSINVCVMIRMQQQQLAAAVSNSNNS